MCSVCSGPPGASASPWCLIWGCGDFFLFACYLDLEESGVFFYVCWEMNFLNVADPSNDAILNTYAAFSLFPLPLSDYCGWTWDRSVVRLSLWALVARCWRKSPALLSTLIPPSITQWPSSQSHQSGGCIMPSVRRRVPVLAGQGAGNTLPGRCRCWLVACWAARLFYGSRPSEI